MAYPISDVTRRVVYSGSIGVGPYSFSFEVLANTDVAVYKNTTLLTLTTDYTVTINANGTGSVTLVSAATGSDTITLVGDRSIERATDFVTGGDLFANSLNDEFDSLVIFAQQVDEKSGRSIRAPVTDPTSINMVLPVASERANKYLGFDSNGNPLVDGDIPDVVYYGPSATAPTLRKNGTALREGDMYLDNSVNPDQIKFYTGSAWVAPLLDTNPTFLGDIYFNGKMTSNSTAMAALDINCSLGNYFTKTISVGTTFTFSNAPSGRVYAFTLELTHTSGTITWPASVVWPSGAVPTLSFGRVHLFTFITRNAGTTWRAAYQVNYTS